jgi:hypothetical protein
MSLMPPDSAIHKIIESLQAIRPSDDYGAGGGEVLEVNVSQRWNTIDVIEAPSEESFSPDDR